MEYDGTERRLAEHCGNHETNTKDISRIKGWIAAVAIIGAVMSFGINRYMNGIDGNLAKIATTTDKTNETVNVLAINNAVTRAEVEQLKKDIADIKMVIAARREK